MNRRSSVTVLVALTVVLASGLSAQQEIRSQLEQRTSDIRAKISDLFAQRDNPIPPLAADLNPFYRVAGFLPEPPPEPEDGEEPIEIPLLPRADAELLEAIAATLRINGIVTYNNRDLIVINQTPTPAGRMITVEFEGKPYFIRVEEIHSNRVVLSLGGAFTILPIAIDSRSSGDPATPAPPSPGLN